MSRSRAASFLIVTVVVLTASTVLSGRSGRPAARRVDVLQASLPRLTESRGEEGPDEQPPDEWMVAQRVSGGAITPAALEAGAGQADPLRPPKAARVRE